MNQPQPNPPATPKKPYKAPDLRRYGTLARLTTKASVGTDRSGKSVFV